MPPLEKNSKMICAKYQDSDFKTVPWAQKVNFRQKEKKYKVKEKNTFSPATQKIIKISKNKKYCF